MQTMLELDGEFFRLVNGQVFQLKGSCQPEKCDAFCCRRVQFVVKKVFDDDNDTFRRHGFEVIDECGQLRVIVEKDCLMLDTQHLRCKDYPNRPTACKVYAKRRGILSSPHCMLEWVFISGRKADVIRSRMLRS